MMKLLINSVTLHTPQNRVSDIITHVTLYTINIWTPQSSSLVPCAWIWAMQQTYCMIYSSKFGFFGCFNSMGGSVYTLLIFLNLMRDL